MHSLDCIFYLTFYQGDWKFWLINPSWHCHGVWLSIITLLLISLLSDWCLNCASKSPMPRSTSWLLDPDDLFSIFRLYIANFSDWQFLKSNNIFMWQCFYSDKAFINEGVFWYSWYFGSKIAPDVSLVLKLCFHLSSISLSHPVVLLIWDNENNTLLVRGLLDHSYFLLHFQILPQASSHISPSGEIGLKYMHS